MALFISSDKLRLPIPEESRYPNETEADPGGGPGGLGPPFEN